ncbi:MAG: SoxR reducing system RseC family protein [Marinagarivorans sp.]|nr:SoxR reducing system RseC family protein [Marinagarivorans sp.]
MNNIRPDQLLADEHWITEQATVLYHDGDALWVAANKTSACGSCKAKSGCGTSLLAKLGEHQVAVRALLADNLQQEVFNEGDVIELAVDRYALVRVALVMYLLPLLGLIAGVLLALDLPEVWVALSALAGLVLGGWAASLCLRRWRNDDGLQPVVLRRALAQGFAPVILHTLP